MMQDPIAATMDEPTGRVEVYRAPPPPPPPQSLMSGANWLQLLLWFVPVIFMAATMYVTLTHLSERSAEHDQRLQHLDSVTFDLKAEQKVMRQEVSDVCKKADKLVQNTEKMDDKLDIQGEDLAAIRSKLNIRDRVRR